MVGKRIFIAVLTLTVSISFGFSQKSNDVIVLDENDNPLKHAWSGGLNAPQFSEIDLNFDGVMDLFVFDREGNRVLTFINNGTSGEIDYTYAPEYESAFPEMTAWCLLRDYDNDGKNDIFTYNLAGIRVYHNVGNQTDGLSFDLEIDPYIEAWYGVGSKANIYVSSQDIPVIDDIDSDGDLDVLSFGNFSLQLNYFRNFAQDSSTSDRFRFHIETYCWGNFEEASLSNIILLGQTCPQILPISGDKGNKHSGASMMTFDPDRDGDKDLLIGDPFYKTMIYLENGGTQLNANIVSQDTNFPGYDTPVNMSLFPSGYNIDVNNDGKKDILVCPNSRFNIENFQGIWYYENVGSSQDEFELRQKDFLQDEMIDLGTNAYPAFFDYNLDGLMDIVVGNGGYYQGTNLPQHSLALFENTGSVSDPKFKLVDTDFAGLSQINLNTTLDLPAFNLVPTFVDINSDAGVDMIVGDKEGRIHYFQNDVSSGTSDFNYYEVDYKGIDVGNYAAPFAQDLNEDGLKDLAIGVKNGKINYYENTGTAAVPEFSSTPTLKDIGGVNVTEWNDFDGYNQPVFYRADGNLYLLCGSKSGYMHKYTDIVGNLEGDFTLVDSTYLGLDLGNQSNVAGADLDGDGLMEYIVGNASGGLHYIESDFLVGLEELEQEFLPEEESIIVIDLGSKSFELKGINRFVGGDINIYSLSGRLMHSDALTAGSYRINMSDYSSGLYFAQFVATEYTETVKLTVKP